MGYRDHLIMRARSLWGNDHELPADLFTEMMLEGIDIDHEQELFEQQDSN